MRLHFLAGDEAATERKFGIGEAQGFASRRGGAPSDFEKHGTGLDYGDPAVDAALTLTHTGFGGLLGDRFVGKDADPNLTLTLEATRHRNTGGFDLLRGHTTTGKGLYTELTKGQGIAFLGSAVDAPFVDFTIFGT